MDFLSYICVIAMYTVLRAINPYLPHLHVVTGLTGNGKDHEGVLVLEWSRPPDSPAHQEEPLPAQHSRGH